MSDQHHSPTGSYLDRTQAEKMMATMVVTTIMFILQLIHTMFITAFNILMLLARK